MTTLDNYRHFHGRHWETGSVANYMAYRDMRAPHTGRPYSEALLLGVNLGGLGTLIASMASLITYRLYAASSHALKGRYFAEFTLWNLVFLAALYALARGLA